MDEVMDKLAFWISDIFVGDDFIVASLRYPEG